MASICNDERVRFGVVSGHDRKTLSLSAWRRCRSSRCCCCRPGQIAAQVEGSVAYGLSATLHGGINLERGRVQQRNFDSCPVLRLAEMPRVEIEATAVIPD